jgi:hypothetical protein
MDKLYRIKDWDKCFENASSRRIARCRFYCVTNDVGIRARTVLGHEHGHTIRSIFLMLVGMCSRHEAPRGGYLTIDGRPDGIPLTMEQLCQQAVTTPEMMRIALDVLSRPDIQWMTTGELSASELLAPVDSPGDETGAVEQKPDTVEPEKPVGSDSGFSEFWAAYRCPDGRKKDKQGCLKIWKGNHLDRVKDRVMAALARDQRSEEWKREGGAFINAPIVWLRKKEWLGTDEEVFGSALKSLPENSPSMFTTRKPMVVGS